MTRGSKRGVPVAVTIIMGLAAACLLVGWYIASLAFFVTAGVVYVAVYWVIPYFRGSRASGQPPSITVDNSPNTTVEANAPRESFGEIEVKDSPGTDIRFKNSEEKDEEA
jgi:hypothetical protein